MAATFFDYLSGVDLIASEAKLGASQTRWLRSSAASWAMDDRPVTPEELCVGAEVLAGRMTCGEARRRFGL